MVKAPAVLVVALLACSAIAAAPAAAQNVDLIGTWECCGSGGAGQQEFTFTSGSGSLAGSAASGGSVFATISGSSNANSVTIVTTYNSYDPGYVATFTGTVSLAGNAMSGTWESNAGQSGTWTATRAGADTTTPYQDCAAPAGELASDTASAAANDVNRLVRFGQGSSRAAGAFAPPPGIVRTQPVTVGATTRKRGRTLTLHRADLRALALLHPGKAPLAGGVALYGLLRPLRAGSVITEAQLGLSHVLLPALHVRTSAWLYWEDLGPLQNFMHPSVVLLIAGSGGRVLARGRFVTFPVINGQRASFVDSRHAHIVYFRPPALRHPVRLSTAQLRRIKSSESLALSLAKRSLAHPAQASKTTLITVTAQKLSDYDAFPQEGDAMQAFFASHGINTTSAGGSVAGLSGAVDQASADGQTTITVFIAGHGSNTDQTAQPTVTLSGRLMVPEGHAPVYETMTADDLATIVQAHPDVTFNFIIDSCYSGRFVDPLSLEPNVASVTTSANATQPSDTPARLLYTNGTNFKPDATTPSGQGIYLGDDGRPGAVSPFVAAEIAALNQAFSTAGAEPDITSVIQDARTLEPSWDLSAAIGTTNPSPDPTMSPTCVAPNTPDPAPSGGWFTGE